MALCIANVGGTDHGLTQKIGSIFASIFGAHEHLRRAGMVDSRGNFLTGN